jgi:hypothetical protein
LSCRLSIQDDQQIIARELTRRARAEILVEVLDVDTAIGIAAFDDPKGIDWANKRPPADELAPGRAAGYAFQDPK